MMPGRPAEFKLWLWLKVKGLRQTDLAAALGRSDQHVSHRIKFAGFNAEERERILAWAIARFPRLTITESDLFETDGPDAPAAPVTPVAVAK